MIKVNDIVCVPHPVFFPPLAIATDYDRARQRVIGQTGTVLQIECDGHTNLYKIRFPGGCAMFSADELERVTSATTFEIGPYTFTAHQRKGREDFMVHVNVGDDHLATLDACWPMSVEYGEVRRAAAMWVFEQLPGIMHKIQYTLNTGLV